MPQTRPLGTVLPASLKAEDVQRHQFVRIDFPDPLGIVRITNYPWNVAPSYSIDLWSPFGDGEWPAQTHTYYDLKVLGVAQEERNPLEVTGIELANVGGDQGTWGRRYYQYGLRELPIVVSEVWWATGAPLSSPHQGAYLLYIGTTDGCELDFVAGTASISVIPFRPSHDVIIGEEYSTAEWIQLPDPNTPVIWGPGGAHRLGIG